MFWLFLWESNWRHSGAAASVSVPQCPAGASAAGACLLRMGLCVEMAQQRGPLEGVTRHYLIAGIRKLWEALMHSRKGVNTFKVDDRDCERLSEDLEQCPERTALVGRTDQKKKSIFSPDCIDLDSSCFRGSQPVWSMKKHYPGGACNCFYLIK